MKYSTNKQFKLPEYTDNVDIADINANFTTIDMELKTLSDGLSDAVSATLPKVTAINNGQFLRVVNGTWNSVTIPAAEEASL